MKQNLEDVIVDLSSRLRKSGSKNDKLSRRLADEQYNCSKLRAEIELLELESQSLKRDTNQVRDSLNRMTSENSKLLRKLNRIENSNS